MKKLIDVDDAIAIVRDVAAQYPADIWPDDGRAPDCKGARMARLTCANIEKALREFEPERPAEVEGEYRLRTIKDIFDKIPADKIELCMKELTTLLVSSKKMGDEKMRLEIRRRTE